MGEVQGTLFRAEFNRSVKIEARRERLSADAGALLMRDVMERLGLPALVRAHLDDPRDPGRITHPFIELFRTWLLLLVQGFADQQDVDLLHDDAAVGEADRVLEGEARARDSLFLAASRVSRGLTHHEIG